MFEWEVDKNESYRSINLIEPTYISGVLDESQEDYLDNEIFLNQKQNLSIVQLKGQILLVILK